MKKITNFFIVFFLKKKIIFLIRYVKTFIKYFINKHPKGLTDP